MMEGWLQWMGDAEAERLRAAVELGKWADGRRLTREERETALQALLAWEYHHRPEEQRTGYMPLPECSSHAQDHGQDTSILRFKD